MRRLKLGHALVAGIITVLVAWSNCKAWQSDREEQRSLQTNLQSINASEKAARVTGRFGDAVDLFNTRSRRAQAEKDVTLYDEVTEDQYKSIVCGRLQKDDFVVDDGVGGYMDNGMDDWGQEDADEDADEERYFTKKREFGSRLSSCSDGFAPFSKEKGGRFCCKDQGQSQGSAAGCQAIDECLPSFCICRAGGGLHDQPAWRH